MTKEEELYAPFMARAKIRAGGEIFLSATDALQFVEATHRAGMAVLGMEGVSIDADGLTPCMDLIADYSPRRLMPWDAYRERCNRLALEFLREARERKGPDIDFCFVLLDRAGYADCLKTIAPARQETR